MGCVPYPYDVFITLLARFAFCFTNVGIDCGCCYYLPNYYLLACTYIPKYLHKYIGEVCRYNDINLQDTCAHDMVGKPIYGPKSNPYA